MLVILMVGLWLAVLLPRMGANPGGSHPAFGNPSLQATVVDQQRSNASDETPVRANVQDDGPTEQADLGHTHGHSAVDHLHDTPLLLPGATGAPATGAADWMPHYQFAIATALPSAMERPPKRAV